MLKFITVFLTATILVTQPVFSQYSNRVTQFTQIQSTEDFVKEYQEKSNFGRKLAAGLFKLPGYTLEFAGALTFVGGLALYMPLDEDDCYCSVDTFYGDPIFLGIAFAGLAAYGLGYLLVEIGKSIDKPAKREFDPIHNKPIARLQLGLVNQGVGIKLIF